MKSKGSSLAPVCVSIKFIDFIFLVSLLTHFKEKQRTILKNEQQKKEAKKKKIKQKQNPH